MSTETVEAWATPELRKAREELERLRGDEAMPALYERRLYQVQLMATELESSYEEGLEEGLEKGRAAVLVNVLEQRFGPVPEAFRYRVKAARSDQIDAWLARVLTASSVEDVVSEAGD